MNAAELQTIVADRPPDSRAPGGLGYWRALVASRNMLALCVMYIPNCMIFYFCITWLPTYLKERHGFEAAELGFFAGLPLIVSVPGDLLGGVATDRLASRYGLRVGRCGLGACRYVIAGVALLAAARSSTPVLAAVADRRCDRPDDVHAGRRVGDGDRGGTQPGGRRGATMNSLGNLAAMLNPLIVAYSVEWFGSWDCTAVVMGVLFLVGAACWTVVDPGRPVFAGPLPGSTASEGVSA